MLQFIKYFLRHIILCIIDVLTKKSPYNEEDTNTKFIRCVNLKNTYVKTDTGYSKVTKIHKTRDFELVRLYDKHHKLLLECADTHIVFLKDYTQVFAKDLHRGDLLFIDGNTIAEVYSIIYTGKRCEMFDLELDDSEHRYYTDGILSHNTTTTAIFFTHFTIFNTDKCAAIAAQRDQIAAEIFGKVKNIISYLPFFLKPGCLQFSATSYKFDNGCSALFRPASIDCLQGYTVDLLFIDEFAYIKNSKAREFWNNVYPTLSAMNNSRVMICSTPNGRNLFYELWTNSLEGKNLFAHMRIDYWEVPGRDQAWVNQEIANLGSKAAFDQQYGLSFDTSVTNALNAETFHYLNNIAQTFESNLFKMRTDYNEFFRWSTLWKYSLKNDWFLISVDVGEGLGGDYSVIKYRKLFVDDNGTIIMPTIGIFECNSIIIEEFAKVILFSTQRFDKNKIRIVIERNTYGDLLMKNIDSLTEKLPNVDIELEVYAKFRRSVDNMKLEKGIRLNRGNKKAGVGNWKKLTEDKHFIETDTRTIDQYREFGDDGRGNFKASVGHDDLVMPDVNAAFYIKSNNTGWNEFIEEFREDVTPDKFNIEVMHNLNLVAIGNMKLDSTLSSDEYEDVDIYDEIVEKKLQETSSGDNIYDVADKLVKNLNNRKKQEHDDMHDALQQKEKSLYESMSREDRMLEIAKELV